MNETLDSKKIEIVKGTVKQEGYDTAFCTIISANVNRTDSLSDKQLYVAEDIELSDGMYAVTPNVTEALDRVPRKTIGVMNEYSEILIPLDNSDIVKINANYIAVKKTNSEEELEAAKSDPTKVQENALISQQIKNKVLEVNPNARFICDDYYGSYDVYEIKDKYLVPTYNDASYIAVNDDDVYIQTNKIEDEIKVIEKEKEEPNVSMPVGALADVSDMPLDNLGELPEMPEELPGAPALNDGDNFKMEDVQTELGSFENNVEMQMPIQEEYKPIEESFTKPIYEETSFEQPVEPVYEEPVEYEEEPIEKETVFKEEYKPAKSYEEKDEIGNTSITKIVSAVKATIAKSENERERLERENVEKDAEINRLKVKFNKTNSELKEKDEKIAEQAAEINRLKMKFNKANAELKEVITENEEQKSEIDRLNDEVTKKDTKIATLKEKRREDIRKVTEAFSGIIDSGALEGRNTRYVEDSNEDDYSYSMVA